MAANAPPTAAITAPAANAKYADPASFTFSATATAPELNDALQRVEFFANGTLLGTDTTSPYSISVTGLTAGTYSLTVKAIDGDGAETTSAVRSITVGANSPPTVSLTAPAANATYKLPATITINATAAAGETNDAIARVEFFANGTLIGTDTTSPYSIAWSPSAAGSYVLTAKATDSLGAETTSAPRTITVAANAPPTAAISTPANNAKFNSPAAFTFSASATAPEANDTVQRVEFYANGNLLGTDTASPWSISVTGLAAGTYSLTVKAIDGDNAETTSAARTIIVSDTNAPPTASLTAPANNATYTAPASITVSANASAVETNGSITKVEFYANGTLIGTDTTSPYSIVWDNVPAGSYTLTAKATDNLGAETTSAARTITVNGSPTVAITSPNTGASFTTPANVTIQATAADPGGSIQRVEFYQGATLRGTDTTAPYEYVWANVPVGNYTLTAKAVDNQGNVTTSAAVTITVGTATSLYYIHPDHLNSPRAITDDVGRTVWKWDNQDPFGNNPADEDPDGDGRRTEFNLRYPGQYADKETGLNYNYFRDYDPAIGRYPQSDPIGLRGGVNTYAYVGGNPLKSKDPLGLAGISISGGVSGFVIDFGGTSTSGIVIGDAGGTPNICYQSVVCGRVGLGLGGMASVNLGFSTAPLCTGQTRAIGAFAQGAFGGGLGGAGSFRYNPENGGASVASANIGPQIGWGGAAGAEGCVITLICANDPPCCKQPGGCKNTCPTGQISDIQAP